MRYNVGDLIFTSSEHSWHDTDQNGIFHHVTRGEEFKIIDFKPYMLGYIHIYNTKNDYTVLMSIEDFEKRFDAKELRKQKLLNIENVTN